MFTFAKKLHMEHLISMYIIEFVFVQTSSLAELVH